LENEKLQKKIAAKKLAGSVVLKGTATTPIRSKKGIRLVETDSQMASQCRKEGGLWLGSGVLVLVKKNQRGS